MEIPILTTQRLVLRAFRLEDLDAHAAMNADPRVMQHIGPVQDREAAFRSMCAYIGQWYFRGHGAWAVEERATGRFIGRTGAMHLEKSGEVEVAYALAASAWGKGYGSELAARVLGYAHEVLGARGVVSLITSGNAASVRIAERLGARFVRDAGITVNGMPVGVYLYPDPSSRRVV